MFRVHTHAFFGEVARQVRLASDDHLAHHQFLVQRISVTVQRGNVVAVLGGIGVGGGLIGVRGACCYLIFVFLWLLMTYLLVI